MNVLAAIVIPPHLGDSGAVNAAMYLSQCLTHHCSMDVALMSDRTEELLQGKLKVMHRRSTNVMSFTRLFLPNKYRTLFYRSDIASLVSNYDLVHIHNPIPAIEMRNIAKACVANKIPYVITTHGFVEVMGITQAYHLSRLESLVGEWMIRKPLEYVIRNAHKICCLAPQDRDLLHNHGVSDEKLVVIPNGVHLDAFATPTADELSTVCAKFQLPIDKSTETPVCFFLANHTRNKGLDVLVDAFRQTDRSYCLIVGGKKRDYDYDGYAKNLKSGQRIVFTDVFTNQEIRVLHHYSDLFVFPTRADTLPLVVLEAMASSKPVLSTTVGGIPYQVDDSCGRLVAPDNPTALRVAFEVLVQDPTRLRAMGLAARSKVSEQFNWNASAAKTFEIYQQVTMRP
jgi:starch synthase